jgi:hypothetical protein
MAELAEERIFVEINPDTYGLKPCTFIDLQALADSTSLGNMINWSRVKEALEHRDGLAGEVSFGRTCWWDDLPMGWRELRMILSGEELSIAGNCSKSER